MTEAETINMVSDFTGKHSCGDDEISMYLLNNIINEIVTPFCHICNNSLSQGIFLKK